jgi:hypothetical protein
VWTFVDMTCYVNILGTFVDAAMTSGTNMGPGYPSFSVDAGQMIYRVPGPFAPDSSVQLPAIRLTAEATGAVGSTIETKMTNLLNVAQFEVTHVGPSCIPNVCDIEFATTTITWPGRYERATHVIDSSTREPSVIRRCTWRKSNS